LERRAVSPRAIDPFGLDGVNAHWLVLEKRALRARREERDAFFAVPLVAIEALRRIPVVADLVIVPERDERRRGVEAPHVLVLQVVAMAAAIVVELLRDARLRLRHDVAPHRSILERDLGLQRLIGIDRVAEMDEDVGLDAPHRLVETKAAAREIDAPPLSHAVAGEGKRDVALTGARRHEERAVHRFAERAQIRKIL